MPEYTLGLFANMYPAFEGDYRGVFIRQMVRDLEARGICVKKAVKTSPDFTGYIPFLCQSLRLTRDTDLDILQAEYIPHSSLVPAIFAPRNIPLVLKFHGDDARIYPFKNAFNRMLIRRMMRRAVHIITGSHEMKRILVTLGESSDRISVIHTGVDTAFFSPRDRNECRKKLHIPEDITHILFVGRLHPWKGVRELVDTARACPEIRFTFIGPGTVPSHTPNCSFIGPQPSEIIRLWLNTADCLALPTYTESVPAVVMEAFSCGIPVIASDVGGCPEIVESGRTGLLVPVRDVQSLIAAVGWMNSHPEERRQMGREARQTAIRKYDHDILTDQLVTLHTRLISK